MQAQGTVQAISNKQNVFNTQNGPAYNGSFKLDDGNWYVIQYINAGQPIPVQQGQFVSFNWEPRQNGNYTNNVVDKKSLNVQGGGQPQGGQQGGYQQQNNGGGYNQGGGNRSYQNRGGGSRSGGGYNDPAKQDQIMRQACMGYAAQLVGPTCDMGTNMDSAAMEVIRLAQQYFFQYAKTGQIPQQASQDAPQQAPMNNQSQQQQNTPQHQQDQPAQQQQQSAPQQGGGFDDFDDDIPF